MAELLIRSDSSAVGAVYYLDDRELGVARGILQTEALTMPLGELLAFAISALVGLVLFEIFRPRDDG